MIKKSNLKDYINYCPHTGKLTWIDSIWARSIVGREVGSVSSGGYRCMTFEGKTINSHRVIYFYMTGAMPSGEIDHIDGCKLNNKWDNLRDVSHSENLKNKRIRKPARGKIFGVNKREESSVWRAMINIDGKRMYLGQYSSFFDACCARLSAQNKYSFGPVHGR